MNMQRNAVTKAAVSRLSQQVTNLERARERDRVDALLAQHGNVPPNVVALCRAGDLANARVLLNALSMHSARDPKRGPDLDPREREALDRAMGVEAKAVSAVKMPDGRLAFSHSAMQRRARAGR